VFEIAAHAIAVLGAFNFSAMHIRRNDLQYKTSKLSAEQSMTNIGPLITAGESIYLATDESSPTFFDALRRRHPVIQFADLFHHGPLRSVTVPPKLIGCVEQVICAMGRRFIGTQYSTFSSYITRLRGYLHAPDTLIYDHNLLYSGAEAHRVALGSRVPSDYLEENPQIWKDTADSGGAKGAVDSGLSSVIGMVEPFNPFTEFSGPL